MTVALHIIDGQTPQDSLEQLGLLAGQADAIASIGPPLHCGRFDLTIRRVHCLLGVPQLAARRLMKLIGPAEVIHAWSPPAAMAALAVGRLSGLGVVLSLPASPQPADRTAVARFCRKGGALTVPTQSAAAELSQSGIAAWQIHVLPPAAFSPDDALMRELRLRTRSHLGVGHGQCLLVAASPMVRGAGHKYACWVHAIVRQIRGDLLLAMPGCGPNYPRVRYFAATTGYDKEMFFTADRYSRLEILSACDVALFLAERDTGCSALAAAMAARRPIVASATPDVSELAPHGQAALLAPPRDPRAASAELLRLVEDLQLAARLAAGAGAVAQRLFAPQACRAKLAQIYAASCGGVLDKAGSRPL